MKIIKWHVYLADLNPKMGTEPREFHPVVVVQIDLLNGIHPSTVICPLTTKVEPKAQYLRVHLAGREEGTKQNSDILVDQIRAIDNRRFLKLLGEISQRNQEKLAENLKILLT